MNQLELEQEVQRYAGEFISRVSSAAEPLTQRPESAALGTEALNRVLLYSSSALDIASGPVPVVNLLDMLVFVRLSRKVFASHFLPQVFGQAGRPLLDALDVSEQRIHSLAARTLESWELARLDDLTDTWLREHPDNVDVEMVRFREFSARAGELREGREARGLLGSVKATVQTADEALVLAERALFLAQRLPLLLRLHARLVARDLVTDTAQSMKSTGLGWRLVGYLAAAGGAWALSFWSGYYMARRMLSQRRGLLAL